MRVWRWQWESGERGDRVSWIDGRQQLPNLDSRDVCAWPHEAEDRAMGIEGVVRGRRDACMNCVRVHVC